LIDQEVKRIVKEASDRAENLLRKNEDVLHRIAKALLEREILDGEEIDRIIQGKSLSPKNGKKKVTRKRSSTGSPSGSKKRIKKSSVK